jgi:hypothetical protein
MIPTNSSGSTNGCDNISSNCVIWQGPDISCIDLCNGDSISEVVFKLATKVCDLLESGVDANPNLEGLDLTCLNVRGATPTQLVPVLQAMVNQICLNADSGGGGNEKSNSLPIMTLPACMQYDDKSGNPVTQLPLDEFATLIANQVCDNLASINTINSTLSSLNTRIDVLEACVLPCSGGVVEAQIVPSCVSNVGTLTNVSVVVLALETAFCSLRNAVGFPSAINSAISQSVITGSSLTRTSSSVSYGSKTGWNNSASTLAESVQNAWIVIDDLYTAIGNIQTNCCPSGCDSVIFDYVAQVVTDSQGLVTGINFNFQGSTIPTGFADVTGFSKIIVTDVNGVSLNQIFSVQVEQSTSGVLFDTSGLNTANDLNVSVQFNVSNGTDTCETVLSSVLSGIVPCPSLQINPITEDGVTVSFANNLGTTASYIVNVINASTGVVAATQTVNNPGPTVSAVFTGLIPSTSYQVQVTVNFAGATNLCPLSTVTFNTLDGDAPCSNGMDVAFVIDYTSSMGGVIDTVKSGAAGLVNTIDTSSGSNNYRISLTTVDEYSASNVGGEPTYKDCADYIALPASQKSIQQGPTGAYQVYTAWEMFQNNNGSTFQTQIAKLNKGVDGTCVNLGAGNGVAEPMDIAIQNIVSSLAFTGSFRSSVAKYVIAITDQLPGGDEDVMNNQSWARIQNLITTCSVQGIKVFVCGSGVNRVWIDDLGQTIYPWRELATGTNGSYNSDPNPTTISSEIVAGCGGSTPLT